jgi:hypothetical protein
MSRNPNGRAAHAQTGLRRMCNLLHSPGANGIREKNVKFSLTIWAAEREFLTRR